MKNYKRIFALTLAAVMTAGVVTGCSSNSSSAAASSTGTATSSASSGAKEIYFLNFKPEIANQYAAIAAEYKKETGVTVKVVTAASGTYESTLKSEIAKTDAPSIFQINGPVGYSTWKDYCADLKDTKLYSYLTDKNMAITGDDKGVTAFHTPLKVMGSSTTTRS
jgi:raffinose/stachyose/melibiose transport system substrate-binding protein